MKSLITAFVLMIAPLAQAQLQQNSLWGSGYWGGQQQQQGCSANLNAAQGSMQSPGGESPKKKESEASLKLKKKKLEIQQSESEKSLLDHKQERLIKKISKFFDSEIADFLLQTHMDKMNKCEDYKTYSQHKCFPSVAGEILTKETKALCDGKDEVPDQLKSKWTAESGGYCNANSNSSRGNVQSAICNDATLRPTDAPSYRTYSTTECSSALSEYRKNKIKSDQLQAKIEKGQDEISDIEYAASEEKEKPPRPDLTEGGCEECALAGRQGPSQKSNRDWWSTLTNVAGGLGLAWYGKKIDQSALANNAQLGIVSTTSYGAPLVSSGLSMIANGLAGNTNCNSGFGSQFGIGSYGGFATGSSYLNGSSALQQQLQTYSQIPVTQQTPDMQVTIAQLQSRINAMNPATGSAYYGLNSFNPISSTGLYSTSGR